MSLNLRRHQNQHPTVAVEERASTAAVSPETVEKLAVKAAQVYEAIKVSNNPNIFPGFESSFDAEGGRVSVLQAFSNGGAQRISLSRDTQGEWTLEHQSIRPNTYTDGVDFSFMRDTTEYPLAFGAVSSTVSDVCRRGKTWDDITVVRRVDDVRVGEPLREKQVVGFTTGLQQLLDLQPQPVAAESVETQAA